jgi:hypothetical protein
MAEYQFERECRTAHSEAYLIVSGDDQVGKVDIHFTPSIVYGTLCVGENITQDGIQDLIDTIDEDLVMSANVARDDFIVTVYQGREVGVFSDEDFEEEEEEE